VTLQSKENDKNRLLLLLLSCERTHVAVIVLLP